MRSTSSGQRLTQLHEVEPFTCYTANINRIKSLLTSRNLAVDDRIRNYLKRYDNQVSLDLLDTLAILSANLIKDEAPQESPDPVL